MPIDMDRFWDDADEEPKRAGVNDAQIGVKEAYLGVKLPAILCEALKRQNGGAVRFSYIRVLPLEEIAPPDPEYCDYLTWQDDGPKRESLFVFAWGADEPMYLLDYSRGPQVEPSVCHVHHDPGDITRDAESLEAFFAQVSDSSAEPAVDWSETTRLDILLFQEMIHESATEYILGRQAGTLVLFTHDTEDGIYTKTTIPEPITTSLDDRYRVHESILALNLEPEDADSVVSIESARTSDGTWKNQTDYGVPVYVTIESHSKEKLQTLREQLIGKEAVRKEDRHAWWFYWVIVPLIVLFCFPIVLVVAAVLYSVRLVFWAIGAGRHPPNTIHPGQ